MILPLPGGEGRGEGERCSNLTHAGLRCLDYFFLSFALSEIVLPCGTFSLTALPASRTLS